MWFAQISLPLRWQRQLSRIILEVMSCCDLLKIHYLCGDKDNSIGKGNLLVTVVICSKFITFAVTKTTTQKNNRMAIVLWFAQNSLPLRWQRQRMSSLSDAVSCCDLLKIHYLCGDKDNCVVEWALATFVVICSKFITFAVTKTTRQQRYTQQNMLWFAQNSLPLRWQRQP